LKIFDFRLSAAAHLCAADKCAAAHRLGSTVLGIQLVLSIVLGRLQVKDFVVLKLLLGLKFYLVI